MIAIRHNASITHTRRLFDKLVVLESMKLRTQHHNDLKDINMVGTGALGAQSNLFSIDEMLEVLLNVFQHDFS